MNSTKITAALCAVFGVGATVFIALSAINLTKGGEPAAAAPAQAAVEYKTGEGVEYNALSAPLTSLISNNQKSVSYPDGILEKLKPAYAVNSDLAGWLTVPGTEIDTAITIANNNDYYITHDFYKVTTNYASPNYGNLFLDYRCGASLKSKDSAIQKNMIIHGHTTGRETGVRAQAFRSLYSYKDYNYFIAHPIIKFSTLYGEYTYKICAVFLTNTQKSADNGYAFNYIYPDMSDSNMVGYIEQVNQRSRYETGVELLPTDKVITLSTCVYDYGSLDTRLVVVGRLLREGESESIDASLVKEKPGYRMPDAWCRSLGVANPYKNSTTWEPSAN